MKPFVNTTSRGNYSEAAWQYGMTSAAKGDMFNQILIELICPGNANYKYQEGFVTSS